MFFCQRAIIQTPHSVCIPHAADGGSAVVRVKLPSCSYFCGKGEQEAPGEPRPGSLHFCFKKPQHPVFLLNCLALSTSLGI